MRKKRIALVHNDLISLYGGGGASRFFINFFEEYCNLPECDQKFDLFFYTDIKSYDYFKDRLSELSRSRLRVMKEHPNRLHFQLGILDSFLFVLKDKIDLFHVCQYYAPTHYHRLRAFNFFSFIAPKLTSTFIHCNFPYEYFDKTENGEIFRTRFDPWFKKIKMDGVLSWYELFKIYCDENQLFKYRPFVYPIKKYYCAVPKFFPCQKMKKVVWAARLDDQKNPFMFLEALKLLKDRKEIEGWGFVLCGTGILQSKVVEYIEHNDLSKMVEYREDVIDMSEIFNEAMCFVSTQFYENFTSLSMNEAMASGMAIISRDVGQTKSYVIEGGNGFLLKSDSPEGLKDMILKYLRLDSEDQKRLGEKSRWLAENIHSFQGFKSEIEYFWNVVLENER